MLFQIQNICIKRCEGLSTIGDIVVIMYCIECVLGNDTVEMYQYDQPFTQV